MDSEHIQDRPAETLPQLGPVVVKLMKGVVYRDTHEAVWQDLVLLESQVSDYVRVIGLELVMDEAEGYAYLHQAEPEQEGAKLPCLMQRRPLSYPVSLLCVPLRKKLVEADVSGEQIRLVLTRDQMAEMMRVFLKDQPNEARLMDRIDTHINKVVELGFLRRFSKDAETLEASSVALRDQNSFTVLGAGFYNAGYRIAVTLAVVLWLPDKGKPPERFYVVADDALHIKDDFSGFGSDIRELKRQLKKRKNIFLYDTFAKYSAAFMRRMGIENSQALNLFFQTVSMKSVGNLTEFVRRHMLEEPPVRERIQALCRQFEDLNKAHAAVLRARDQVEQLQPLADRCRSHRQMEADIERHRQYRDVLHGFFAGQKARLLQGRIEIYEAEEEKRTARMVRVKEQLAALRLDEQRLRQAIFENGGNRLAELATEIERLTAERGRIRQRADAYLDLCRRLDFAKPRDEAGFSANRKAAEKRLGQVDARVAEQENRQVETKVRLKELGARISDLEAELDSIEEYKEEKAAYQKAGA